MLNHYESMAKYLCDCGWESVAKTSLQHRDIDLKDTDTEIRTFLNYLTVQDAGSPTPSCPMQSESAVAEKVKKTREVSFAPGTQKPVARPRRYYSASSPRSPTGNSERVARPKCYSAPRLRRLPSRGQSGRAINSISAITSQRTFSSRAFKLSVPWPTQTSPVDWYGVILVLHDQVTHAVLSHCAPWSWVSDPVPSTAEEQALWQQNVYRPIDLAAKLCALNRHNTVLRQSLESFARSIRLAANDAAVITSIPHSRWYQDHFEACGWKISSIKVLLEKLFEPLKKALARREKIARVIEKIKTLARELVVAAAEPGPKPTLASYLLRLLKQSPAEPTKSPTGLATGMVGLCAALLPALEAVEEGMDKLVKTAMVGDTVRCFQAMRDATDYLIFLAAFSANADANANDNGVSLSATPQNQAGAGLLPGKTEGYLEGKESEVEKEEDQTKKQYKAKEEDKKREDDRGKEEDKVRDDDKADDVDKTKWEDKVQKDDKIKTEDKGRDEGFGRLEKVAAWYRGVLGEEALSAMREKVPAQEQQKDEERDGWEKVAELARILERAERMYRGLEDVMGGLKAGAKVMRQGA